VTIDVTVNGVVRSLSEDLDVESLVAELVASSKGVAVAIDREVVPRSAWASTVLRDGQLIEIVTAAAGG
jgi:sulfur carrier protein